MTTEMQLLNGPVEVGSLQRPRTASENSRWECSQRLDDSPTERKGRATLHKSSTRSFRRAISDVSLTKQERARVFTQNPWWQISLGVLAVCDFAFLLFRGLRSLRGDAMMDDSFLWLFFVNAAYSVDVLMRMKIVGAAEFLLKWRGLLDLLVITAGCCDVLLVLGTRLQLWDQAFSYKWAQQCISIFRLVRALRVITLLLRCPCLKGSRYVVSGSRRRYIDHEGDFDLDLSYVTPRVIAMSIPCATWPNTCFRNVLTEVARFLDTKHSFKYLVVNCCPECPYDDSAYETGEVLCFDIKDHQPPTMAQFLEFVQKAENHMDESNGNVLVVHCKAGKGRTGCMVCAWLLFSGQCEDVDDALAVFALARTDTMMPGDLVGVETPSQVRYLHQFADMIDDYGAASLPAAMPEKVVFLTSLRLQNIWKAPPPALIAVVVHEIDDVGAATIVYWSGEFRAADSQEQEIDLSDHCIRGDIRISVVDCSKRENFETSDAIAGKEPGCLLYFLFHVSCLSRDGLLEIRIGSGRGHYGVDRANKKPEEFNMDGILTMAYNVI